MAAPAQPTNGEANGTPQRFIDKETFDPDDLERERELMKSAEVKEDMRGMEARKRVSEILHSQAFRDELEDIIETQDNQSGDLKSGPHPASLVALQQISSLILPNSSAANVKLAGATVTGTIIPIADIRGINASVYSKGERLLRCKLASLYRMMDLKGWTSGIYNHITLRLSQDKEHFLLNPFGLLYREVTAGSLIKVDMQGNIVDPGNTNLDISKAGFILHSALHAARPDIRCIIHSHVPEAVAVGCMKRGLLPLSQESMLLGPITYHDYRGVLINDVEKEQLGRNLGPNSKVMFLRNHGVVCCGESVEEAFRLHEHLITACKNQVSLLPVGIENLLVASEEVQEQVATNNSVDVLLMGQGKGKKWKLGELEWEAEMRVLDNAGYRTGHVYKLPVVKCERTDRQTSDVEYPPATSLLAFYDNEGNLKPAIREAQERNKRNQKTDWLNTPNVYKREEVEEIGTDNPKKYTKWVKDQSPEEVNPAVALGSKNQFAPLGGERLEMKQTYRNWVPNAESPARQGTSIKVENRNQFAPLGSNPKEFIQQQRQIKDGYYTDKIDAGYQSKILEGGVTEGQLMDANSSMTGDHVMVVGAASKGIIKREHQHNAIVYRSYYTTNPFDKMTQEELTEYEEAVKRGEKPSQEEVLADLEQQQQLEVEAAPASGEPEATPVVITEPPSSPAPTQASEGELYSATQSNPALNASPEAYNEFKPSNPQSNIRSHSLTKGPPVAGMRYRQNAPATSAGSLRRASSKETSIDDLMSDTSPTPAPRRSTSDLSTPMPAIRRGTDQYSSMKQAKTQEKPPEDTGSFKRSKSERKPKKGERPSSPGSDAPQNGEQLAPEEAEAGGDKKDKKKKSRMPSFLKKKESKKAGKQQTAI